MPDNHDVFAQLAKSRDRWKALAIASLILLFVGLIPFTVVVNHLIGTFGVGPRTSVTTMRVTVPYTRPSK